MPLRDHLSEPAAKSPLPVGELSRYAWANAMVIQLNQELLPANFWAIPKVHIGSQVEVDVATLRLREEQPTTGNGTATAVWSPHQAALAVEIAFADQDTVEVQIRDHDYRRLVAAIELVSPGNKDRPGHRRDFAVKCAAYLQQQVALYHCRCNYRATGKTCTGN